MLNLYTFAFAKNIKINKLKEMFWRDDLKKHEKLLFHGAKSKIDGKIDIHRGRHNNDFGQGFYAGESYEQAISFVSGFENSSVNYICFNDDDLTCKRYEVNQEWMMTITYEFTSARVYKIIKPKELRELFLPYHTLDPSQAIERILEAKGLLLDEEAELQRQYEIFRKIRMGSK